MKTKQFIYGVIYFLLIAIAIITENLIPALLLMLLAGSDYLIIKKDNTISQLTSKISDAEKKLVEKEDELHHSVSVVKNQFQEINNLKKELETAKANSYREVERKRCREKYNRLYKGKKKAKVATEQKSEPKKIEPFRMVVNPKQSAIVQQILFDNGYMWMGGDVHVKNTDVKALSFEGDKITSYDFYPHTDSVYFEDTHLPKLSFKKFMQLYGAKEQPYQINK